MRGAAWLMLVGVSVLSEGSGVSAASGPEPALPPKTAEEQHAEDLWLQWVTIAPEMSMDNPKLRWVSVTPETIREMFEEVEYLESLPIDADPLLATVGQRFLQDLVDITTTIVPGWRSKDASLWGLLAEEASRALEAQIKQAVQDRLDAAQQATFAELLPVARRAAAPVDDRTGLFEPIQLATSRSEFLGVRNLTETELHHVTIAAELHGMDGLLSRKFYFIDTVSVRGTVSIPRGEDTLSVPMDRVVEIVLEVLSDEVSTRPETLLLVENMNAEAHRWISDAEQEVRLNPERARSRISRVMSKAELDAGMSARATGVQTQAEALMPAYLLRLERVRRMRAEIDDLNARMQKIGRGAPAAAQMRERVERLNRDIRELQATELREIRGQESRVATDGANAAADQALHDALAYATQYPGLTCELLQGVITEFPNTDAAARAEEFAKAKGCDIASDADGG